MSSDIVAYPLAARLLAATLIFVSRGYMLFLAAALWVSTDPPSNPLRLMRLFAGMCLTPELLRWLLERSLAVRVRVGADALVLERRADRIEIPLDSIAAIRPWILPMPESGVWLRLKSGRRFRYGLQLNAPAELVEALIQAGAREELRATLRHPMLVFARAKAGVPQRWLDHPAFKFVVYALVPTLPLWRVHQYIAYGGTFGEYYQYGAKAYLLGFSIYWGTLIVYLVLYATVLRTLAEVLAMSAALVAPSQAARVRRAVEVGTRVAFYVGVPAFLILRFFPWS